MSSLWESLVDAICRPPRDDAYSLDDLVGGRSGRFSAAGKSYTRRDFALINRRRQRVVCSLFEGRAGAGADAGVAGAASASAAAAPFLSSSLPAASSSPFSPAPVVIYAHCNSGSRRDAEEVMGLLLPAGIAVAALDFSGSGLSDGAHVSLGAFEAEDLADLIALLAAERGPGCRIAIWGRSMGAVAALLAAAAEAREAAAAAAGSSPSSSTPPARPPPKTNIAAVVLDSPFSSLPELMAELVAKQRLLPLPRALLSPNGFLLRMMARSVEKRAGFDLRGVVPVRAVSGAGSGCPSSSSRSSSSSSSSSVGRSKSKATAASGADGAPASSAASSPDEERRRLFASLLPPALFGHAEADSFIAPRHSRALHGRYLGSDKALCAFGGDHNSARPASFRSAALGFLKEALFPAAAGGAGGGGGGGGGGERRAVTTAAAPARHDGGGGDARARLPPLASLGAATASDAALSAAAPDHRGLGAVAAGHAADERESWGRAASLAAPASAAAGPGRSSPPWHASGGGNGSAEEEDEELLEMERAIAASLELTCAEAEREAREAKEAALAAAAAAAAATEQLRRETQQREREHQAAAAVTRGSCFAPPASSLLETATTAAAASFDLTPDQRELHAFFSPPSPTAAAAAEKRIRQEQQRERAWEREQQRKPAAIAASKRPLALPKAPPVFPSSSSSAPSRKNVEARAGGWKS